MLIRRPQERQLVERSPRGSLERATGVKFAPVTRLPKWVKQTILKRPPSSAQFSFKIANAPLHRFLQATVMLSMPLLSTLEPARRRTCAQDAARRQRHLP